MEFGEKLQTLRKSRGWTQEELAEALFVSRTAVSKWESGRGLPNIDSLKEISKLFSVSLDELLSGDKLLSLAEKETKTALHRLRGTMMGAVDLLSVLLIILPLYPNKLGETVVSVNLIACVEISPPNKWAHWILFLALMVCGLVKTVLSRLWIGRGQKLVTVCSVGLSIAAVLLLGLSREAYAVTLAFVLFVAKVLLLMR